MYLCYCIDKESGDRRRAEVFKLVRSFHHPFSYLISTHGLQLRIHSLSTNHDTSNRKHSGNKHRNRSRVCIVRSQCHHSAPHATRLYCRNPPDLFHLGVCEEFMWESNVVPTWGETWGYVLSLPRHAKALTSLYALACVSSHLYHLQWHSSQVGTS